MPSYTIFEKPDLSVEDSIESAVLVKNKFSYLAFLLPIVWMLVKRLWWVLLGYGLLMVALSALDSMIPLWASILVSGLVAFLVAIEAPSLQAWSLQRKGYREIMTLYAEDRDHCEARYITARLEGVYEGQAQPPTRPAAGQTRQTPRATAMPGDDRLTNPPVIGLFPKSENA